MNRKRIEQIGEQLRQVLAELFVTGGVRDKRISAVSVHRVKVSPDLQVATLYFGILSKGNPSPEEVQLTEKALARASGFLRSHIADHLELRIVPQLRFFYDDTIEKTQQVLTLLSTVSSTLGADSSSQSVS